MSIRLDACVPNAVMPCRPFDTQLSHQHRKQTTPLSLGAPDALEEAIPLGESVHSIVAFTHGTHETAKGVGVVLALNLSAVLVNLGDGDLGRSVVLGLDDSSSGRALSRDVKVDDLSLVVLHFGELVDMWSWVKVVGLPVVVGQLGVKWTARHHCIRYAGI